MLEGDVLERWTCAGADRSPARVEPDCAFRGDPGAGSNTIRARIPGRTNKVRNRLAPLLRNPAAVNPAIQRHCAEVMNSLKASPEPHEECRSNAQKDILVDLPHIMPSGLPGAIRDQTRIAPGVHLL